MLRKVNRLISSAVTVCIRKFNIHYEEIVTYVHPMSVLFFNNLLILRCYLITKVLGVIKATLFESYLSDICFVQLKRSNLSFASLKFSHKSSTYWLLLVVRILVQTTSIVRTFISRATVTLRNQVIGELTISKGVKAA